MRPRADGGNPGRTRSVASKAQSASDGRSSRSSATPSLCSAAASSPPSLPPSSADAGREALVSIAGAPALERQSRLVVIPAKRG